MLLCGGVLQGELPSGAMHCIVVFFNVGVDATTSWWKCTMRRRLVGMQCNAELVLCNVGTRHVLQCRTRGAVQPAMPPVGGGTA